MALTGNWIGYNEMESAGGKRYIICSIEYKGKPWGRLSTFDEAIIEEAERLSEGDEVTFETRKSGDFTNIIKLNNIGSSGKGSSSKQAGTQKKQARYKTTGDETDWDKIGDHKAWCGMMNAAITGYVTHHGKFPDGKELTEIGHKCAVQVMKLRNGEYFNDTKDQQAGIEI